jgi:transposase InsO family protein
MQQTETTAEMTRAAYSLEGTLLEDGTIEVSFQEEGSSLVLSGMGELGDPHRRVERGGDVDSGVEVRVAGALVAARGLEGHVGGTEGEGDGAIERPDQVWCSDITYIPMAVGFMYLVVIMDWFSRYVLAWELSNTLEVAFCVEALEGALARQRPEIFNSDQGVQFTSEAFTGCLHAAQVKISMDGRGRTFDNIFIERLWRSLKYEDIYLKDYQTVPELITGLNRYFEFYNHERPHQGLDDQTPAAVYKGMSVNQEASRLS